jgi:hypothetical protein
LKGFQRDYFFVRRGKIMTDWPKITARRTINVSPWMQIIEREVKFAPGAKPELYHAVGQQDYTAIVARTPDGQLPIVRQYRPALERFTWELPAGLVDRGEAPEVLLPARIASARSLGATSLSSMPGSVAGRSERGPAPCYSQACAAISTWERYDDVRASLAMCLRRC